LFGSKRKVNESGQVTELRLKKKEMGAQKENLFYPEFVVADSRFFPPGNGKVLSEKRSGYYKPPTTKTLRTFEVRFVKKGGKLWAFRGWRPGLSRINGFKA